jgi:hypothetical protein
VQRLAEAKGVAVRVSVCNVRLVATVISVGPGAAVETVARRDVQETIVRTGVAVTTRQAGMEQQPLSQR